MVNYCHVYGCSNIGSREVDRSFFRIPAVIRNQGEVCKELSTNPACGTLQYLRQFVGGRHIVVSLVEMVRGGIDINSVTLIYDLCR